MDAYVTQPQQEDILFMREALRCAEHSAENGEVPVGAVIVKDGQILSRGYNRREQVKNALCHAELEAIAQACRILGGWRLWQCTIYITLEPCPMCAGAIINARLERVVFGAYDKKAGSCGSVVNLFDLPYNHKPKLTGGVLQTECSAVLRNFFKELRQKKSLIIHRVGFESKKVKAIFAFTFFVENRNIAFYKLIKSRCL